ncbi:MAG: GNAT family N-acetyltransferase, partial [Anaerolineales bacterium]|nr:GNAT family N-acetyltransferase [Anaerolineales bacterium]
MHLQLIHGDSVFDTLADEWNTLARQGITNTPFQHLAYQKAWWQHLQPNGATLHTFAARDEAGTLVGLLCLYNMDGLVHFNGCVEETDYLDAIVLPDYAEALWMAVFQHLDTDDFPIWHTLDFCNVPQDSPSRVIVPPIAAQHGLVFAETIHEVCPVIQLPATFDEYLESIDSKQRREIRRKLRRADGAEAELVIVQPGDDVETAVTDFLDLLAKSTFEKRDWLNDGRRAVFHDTAKVALADGYLLLMFIEVDGRKASALFNFDYNNHVLVYNSGLDPAAFGPLSLGEVLTAKAIEWAIANGRSTFDFLRGNETYKY